MKLRFCCLIVLMCMLALGGTASATEMLDGRLYTDVASVMTQDAVLNLEVITESPEETCGIELLQPDVRSMALLEKVYDFVWRQGNRPVRYYDEETQRKIEALVPGVDIDILHLTEFMAQRMQGVPTGEVTVERLLDVDYRPGQTVVVVLGYEMENGEYRWFPYRAEVPEIGLIRYSMPKADYDELASHDRIIYHVLADRVGARGETIWGSEIIWGPNPRPSKSSRDIISIRYWHTSTGEVIDDRFSIYLTEKTEEMNREIQRIGSYLTESEENKALGWFPEEIANQAQLLLGDAKKEEMIIYDIVAVRSEEYKDAYGDVATENLFASEYSPEHRMVVLLGFELTKEELAEQMGKEVSELTEEELEKVSHFEWYCLRAEALEDVVEIVFKQLVIPQMEIEPAMLVVLSEPLDQ